MDSKIIVTLFFLIIFSSCKSQEFKAKEEDSATINSKQEIIDDRENSKKYALCSCLFINGYNYKDDSKKDNSAYSYIAKGLKHPQFYSDLFNFTEKEIQKMNYKSFEGDKTVLKMVECIDFYTSSELEKFIISIENKNHNE